MKREVFKQFSMPNARCPMPNHQSQCSTKNPLFMQIIIITAADANYFELVRGTILSVREKPQGANVAIGFFDLGCTSEQLQWLETQVDFIKIPDWDFDFPGRNESPEHLKGLLVRPYLRKYFPNFDIYIWIDADAWVQDWKAIDLFVEGASRRGLAIVPEVHRASLQQYGQLPEFWKWVYQQYEANFGAEVANKLYSYPILNAGVFALRKDALHWDIWAEKLNQGLQQSGCVMTDQFALNLAVYSCGLFNLTEMLPAWCNWIFNGFPVWDKQKRCFVEPYLPQEAIGILHLAGRQQFDRIQLMATDGDILEISVRYQAKKQEIIQIVEEQIMTDKKPTFSKSHVLSRTDYVSPGLQIIRPDSHFPNMILTDPNTSNWPYLRREIPHNWYTDQRYPFIGFLSRDEAHILYNTALQFKGKKALEIGCWLGWSACHLALAGVALDVVDPLLERDDIRQSVIDSIQGALNASGVQTTVELLPGYSPQRVEQFATQLNRKWSLIFIDGEHGGLGPLNDAIVCEKFAEEDAIILFHDLTAPDVAKGLDYLKQRGWHTIIYQTMQIMGAAWRGNVEPVKHQPDPNISWDLPAHLQGYDVSGMLVSKDLPKQQLPTLQQQNWQTIIQSSQSLIKTSPEDFLNIYSTVRPYTMLSESRLFSLYCLAKQICVADLPGNFVECGTCKGGSAALLAFVIKHYSRRPRVLYAFDTFEGMPPPTEIDQHQGIPANLTGFGEGTLKAPISENLDKICELMQVKDIVVPVKGLFAQTLPKYKSAIGNIAFLHADGDWYESTMDIFNTLYESVVPKGFIQVDDYGHWQGCKQALHDFETMKGESFLLHTIDETGVWFQKSLGS
jgi:predicted O-methyltransferase YrrM